MLEALMPLMVENHFIFVGGRLRHFDARFKVDVAFPFTIAGTRAYHGSVQGKCLLT
jgi:hypothetical protein